MKNGIVTKIRHRDSYGIARGALIMSLVLILAMGMNMFVHSSHDTNAVEARVSDAARQIAAQFQQMIEDSVSQMSVAADYLREGVDEQLALNALSRNAVFSASAIIEGGELLYSSGSVNVQDNIRKSAVHQYGDIRARIIAQDDNAIQLRISVQDKQDLAAWISPERVAEVLSRAYDGEYEYAVYNDDTGVYLINHTHFEEHGYYDALLDRNGSNEMEALLNNPQAQAFVEGDSTADGAYYIAQMPTEIESWRIALLVPVTLIDSNQGLPRGLYLVDLVTIGVCLAAIVLLSVWLHQKIHGAKLAGQRENDLLRRLAERTAMHGQMKIFQYNPRENQFKRFFDGTYFSKTGTSSGNIDVLAELCGFEHGEAERIRERCLKMQPGAESELNVHAHINGIERFQRVCLKCCEEDANVILGCILDCTQGVFSQNSIEDERNFFSMMKPKTSSIWQINVAQNRWRVSHCVDAEVMEFLGVRDRSYRDYESDLNGAIRRYIHGEDYPAFAEEMSVNGLMTLLRKGKLETVHEYRAYNSRQKEYQWHRQIVHVFCDPDTQEVMANLYILNVDAEKKAEIERRERSRTLQRSLTALGGLYRALFYVDLEKNICYTAKAPDGEPISKLQSPYRATFDDYIDRMVAPEDRKKLKEFTGAYQLLKGLTEANHTQYCEYMRISGDNLKKTAIIVQAARFENGTVRDVVVALRNIE